MAENEQPVNITMANTKKEMLAAYNQLLKTLREKEDQSLDAPKKLERRAAEEALKTADSLSTEGVVKASGNLKAEIGTLLTQVSDRLETEVRRYQEVRKAIEAKEKELAEIYEIEKAAASLAALIEAQHQKRASFETEMAARKEELQGEIEATRFQWQEEKASHSAEAQEWNAAEKKRREREREEYQYAFERERRLARDQFEDEKNKLEAELEARRAQVERELADKEALIAQREEAVAERERRLDELQSRVGGFPQELEAAVQKAVQETTQRLRLEAKNREELLTRELTGEKNVLTTRIESLERTIQEQQRQIEKLSEALDKAYQQVQDIAVRAVQSSSAAKALAEFQSHRTEPPPKIG